MCVLGSVRGSVHASAYIKRGSEELVLRTPIFHRELPSSVNQSISISSL